MTYEIRRVSSDKTHGTFGVFLRDGVPMCVTMEETWLDNAKEISCIPAGTYAAKRYSGTVYKDVWIVENVPNRSAILIHWGNTERHTAGCILMGQYFADFGDRRGVANSKKTIEMLRDLLPLKFQLTITDCF